MMIWNYKCVHGLGCLTPSVIKHYRTKGQAPRFPGLAIGEGGTDISMETADVVLMADKLKQFSHAYSPSKATIRNMKQNTFFAVGIVFVLLTGVLAGSVHLAYGMFIHEASVLLVILNAMRLIRFNPESRMTKVTRF